MAWQRWSTGQQQQQQRRPAACLSVCGHRGQAAELRVRGGRQADGHQWRCAAQGPAGLGVVGTACLHLAESRLRRATPASWGRSCMTRPVDSQQGKRYRRGHHQLVIWLGSPVAVYLAAASARVISQLLGGSHTVWYGWASSSSVPAHTAVMAPSR